MNNPVFTWTGRLTGIGLSRAYCRAQQNRSIAIISTKHTERSPGRQNLGIGGGIKRSGGVVADHQLAGLCISNREPDMQSSEQATTQKLRDLLSKLTNTRRNRRFCADRAGWRTSWNQRKSNLRWRLSSSYRNEGKHTDCADQRDQPPRRTVLLAARLRRRPRPVSARPMATLHRRARCGLLGHEPRWLGIANHRRDCRQRHRSRKEPSGMDQD